VIGQIGRCSTVYRGVVRDGELKEFVAIGPANQPRAIGAKNKFFAMFNRVGQIKQGLPHLEMPEFDNTARIAARQRSAIG